MFRYSKFFLLFSTALILALSSIGGAEAKRFGGGRSFGGKSFYSQPFKRSQLQRQRTFNQQKAIQRNQTSRQSWRNRGGLLGWLAPFAIGGLLGALFFGGAFEHLNLMDILVFGGLALLAFKLLSRRSGAAAETPVGAMGDYANAGFREKTSAPFDTDILGKKDRSQPLSSHDLPAEIEIPSDFDLQGFLEGAKRAFRQLQEAWNRNELAEIRGLTTDEVFIEIKRQKAMADHDLPVKILDLDAELVGFEEDAHYQQASVLFTARIQEGSHSPETIQEVWHFVRPRRGFNATWQLDGIQQVED
ncbi:MAG: hypothetical protein AXA67_11460 [Methylothermaceae bacteria B42]|nr:MAG: hypothetical protein AXA67_11460 [Methylothermaceae bacteria B42]HHJ39146.1 Tim44 domain-containing protein [Methylothermaceae bacterium]